MQKSLVVILGFLILASGCTVSDEEYCVVGDECTHKVGADGGQAYTCHPTRHVCIPVGPDTCFTNMDCRDPSRPRCDVASNQCQPCVLSENPDSCGHLATPYCSSVAGSPTATTCVACRANLDCPYTTPICDGNVCRKCNKHSDCAGKLNCESTSGTSGTTCQDSLVCISDTDMIPDRVGTCAQNGTSGRVVYVYEVHNDTADCSDDSGRSGTEVAKPFCTVNVAYTTANSQGRRYVRVLDSGSKYLRMQYDVSDGVTISFIGSPAPSLGANKPAMIGTGSRTFSVINGGSVTVDEFEIVANFANNVIGCAGSVASGKVPSFTLRNSIVRGNTLKTDTGSVAVGVDLYNCNAQIYGNVIGIQSVSDLATDAPAFWIGMRAQAEPTLMTRYDIYNNVIAGNWGQAADFYAVANTALNFRFNTVVGNGRAKGFGGITCSNTSSLTLGYSLLIGNTPMGGTQLDRPGGCKLSQVVVGLSDTVMDPGLIKITPPDLTDAFYLSPSSVTSDCCVDKAQPKAGENFPTIDIRGTARPQGSGWDIGAFELPK